jgi:anaerobic ribonucleoside-triphosphate reductase activating protein
MLTGQLGDWAVTREMLSLIDVLVDGEFHLKEKDLSLRFRGSSNQRIIDVPRSLALDQVLWWDGSDQP